MNAFQQPISHYIWDIKYRYHFNNKNMDETIENTWQRIACAIAKAEKLTERNRWEQKFYQILEDFRFLPGGRIIAGAGTAHKVTLFNCFVMPIAEDSIKGIFNALKEGALTLQKGGGVGYGFSILRPRGKPTDKTGALASGPVSFMRIWDKMSATMLSTGSRRGAMMATLRCDHPDIEEFITAKANSQELRQFNVSVVVTDEFMQAVRNNKQWALVFPVADHDQQQGKVIERCWIDSNIPIPCRVYRYVNARKLWQKIIKSAYDYAEPGVLFEDTINRMNPLWYRERITITNPCGEIPLPAYGACNLGSINLTQFILDPFSSKARIDWEGIEKTTAIATRFLDNVISVSHYPLPAQKRESLATRRIGLGFTGLGDALIMLGIRYGNAASLKITRKIMQTIAYTTWNTSIELAKEKGSFPALNKRLYLQGNFVKKLPIAMRKKIAHYGVRNSHHNAIAPTGTISLLANNVSNGLEPVFSAHYERKVMVGDSNTVFQVEDYAYHLWKQKNNKTFPPAWVDTQTLSPTAHLRIQGTVQPFVDHAVSKTINLPEKFPFTKLNEIYTEAYRLGLKGCTIFRPNPITGSVLSIAENEKMQQDNGKRCEVC